MFVDRVLYGGPDEQRLALGSLAGATALGAFVSGFAVRVASYRIVTLVGLALRRRGTHRDVALDPVDHRRGGGGCAGRLRPGLRAVGDAALGRGGRVGRAGTFGAASSVVTVARMLGMAVGLAVLTAYGSTTIDRLSAEIYETPEAYLDFVPEHLRDRPLKDPLVVEALESWASREAASIMVGLYVVAAIVTIVAVPPALALGGGAGRRGPRRAYAGQRWRARPRPHPLSERRAGAGEPMTRRHAPVSSGHRAGSSSRPSRTGSFVKPRASGASSELPALPRGPDDDRLGRHDRSIARAGRIDRRGPQAPSADHRGRARGQPASEDREHRRPHPHRALRA